MKFKWEVIYDNDLIDCPLSENTYRAKVFGGWLVRHEVSTDYQFVNENDDSKKYIYTEGYQNVTNTIIFLPDANHEWEI